MARRIRVQSLIASLLCATALEAGVLAHHTFDDDDLATGPDTFAVFEHAKGSVEVASDIRFSGYNSVAITDVSRDGDFPELQGYFPVVRDGVLRFRFAMLVATPHEELNVALAGPNHFSMSHDGIAFWLKSRDGWLLHVSDSMPKKLFVLQPFAWYVVDVRYDVRRGSYDLSIMQEGVARPVVEVKDQPNATSSPGSAAGMFSFAGSVYEDHSDVRYYVDDVALAATGARDSATFAAPGRRKLFVDRWHAAMKADAMRRGCPPVLAFQDVGVEATDVTEARKRLAWIGEACARLDDDRVLRQLEARDAPAYALARIVALTRRGRWSDAEAKWLRVAPLLRDDVRYGWMAALLGMHRENWDEAEAWLRVPADELATLERDVTRKLIAEEYYFVLLWKTEYAEAARYAERVASRLASIGVDASYWRERAGDAELLGGRTSAARAHYRAVRAKDGDWSITAKLADVAHLEGDAAEERRLREKLYGSLR